RGATWFEARERDRCLAKFLWPAAETAARSVHTLRLGSPVGSFDAAKTRRGARGIEADLRDEVGCDLACVAEEARRECGACRTLSRKPTHRPEDRRRSLPALAR